MARNKSYSNKGENGAYSALYRCVSRSVAFGNLSGHAVKLLIELMSNYNGSNNGDLSAAYSVVHKRGWKSKGTLNRAIQELIQAGFIETSRQGGRHKCSLYALTFYAIDECGGKLEINATNKPTSLWRKNEPLPSIQQLQQAKLAIDKASVLKQIMDISKRSSEIKIPAPHEGLIEADCSQ